MRREAADVSLDLAAVLDRLGGDRELLCDIARIFLELGARHLDQLAAEVAASDCAAVARRAHELKGMSANLGALEMLRQSKLLEMTAQQQLPEQMREHCDLLRREFDRVCLLLIDFRKDFACGGG